ncbi:flavin-containing monooxygenase [Nocardioides houyundeii]|uniref:flavin-containing monooxygenase n=1 Tax=Nocardioides houyundeii TaxID=2045452 RepID=UPI000DF36583|nr:NAD(P)/FAD-dependent oxidoreductase [Nocardioides houyundeii]
MFTNHETYSDHPIVQEVIREILDGLDEHPDAIRRRYDVERDKRIRKDGLSQYRAVADLFPDIAADPYAERFERPPLVDEVEVVIVGGGFAGLSAAARLRDAGCTSIRIIDEAGDFGGTWYWNRYPGAMCDVESYIYLPLLEEVGYVPKHKYAYAPEIREHARKIGEHYRLYDDACLQTGVTDVAWDDDAGRWTIRTNRDDVITSRFVVIASGPLSKPKAPAIPGMETFSGKMFHTSRWDYEYTGGNESGNLSGLADKRVGIVGTGATGIQVVPHLGECAKELYVFQRTPNAVGVRAQADTDPDWAASLTPGWQKRRMDHFMAIIMGKDVGVDEIQDGWTDAYQQLTGLAAKRLSERIGRRLTAQEKEYLIEAMDLKKMSEIRRRVDETVTDRETAEALKPWYRFFCKRPGFHDEYLPTFNRPNARLVDTHGQGVTRIEGSKVFSGGEGFELDCLILATGFEVGTAYTTRNGYDVVGRHGHQLSEKWKDGFKTFHGLHSHNMPNAFFMGRIQTGTAVNYVHTMTEQAAHIAYVYSSVKERGWRAAQATVGAEADWVAEIASSTKFNEAYYASCTPGYYNNEGDVKNKNGFFSAGSTYGGGPLAFFDLLEAWRAEGSLPGLEEV